MKTIIIPLAHSREARITIGRTTPWGVNVSSIMFDADGEIIGSTPTTTYFGYCEPEIAHRELSAMFDEPDDEEIAAVIESASLRCNCELDDDDCAV